MGNKILDSIQSPADLKPLNSDQLKQLAGELRADMIQAVSQTGGHLGAGLGVVELTTALHYIFDAPKDKIIWDVGHQAYPHKILTGRRDAMRRVRKADGPSGFCKRSESEYDAFGAGHSSTSISAGLGMAVARDLKKPSPSGRGLGEGPNCQIVNVKQYEYSPEKLIIFARELRKEHTKAEAYLWEILRNRQIAGLKFRRQHTIQPYIADFYCHDLSLIIELDGKGHCEDDGPDNDARRTAHLKKMGYKVLRYDNDTALNNVDKIIEDILALTPALSQREREIRDFNVIAVIGDGAMSAGMAFEAMNNAGAMGKRLIVILNDNDMSIAPPVGAMSAYLARLISSRPYHTLRDIGKKVASKFPAPMADMMRRAEHMARDMVTGGTLFEQLGFYYVGPVDGHNLDHLLPVLKNVRDEKNSGPVLIHVVTEKGRGFNSPDASAEKYHAVATYDVETFKQNKKASGVPTYTSVFAESLIKEAEEDERIVAITAAMPSGTGLDKFAKAFPKRMFDVGIAEQHAVTFAAGMAAEGMKPFVAIYSTFLQRAYDQIVHDVAIQNLPVRFAIDRAGLVGADGATHAGSFDVAYLCCLPNMVVAAAADESELVHMTATAAAYDAGPFAYRYPRGEGVGVALPEQGEMLEIGKGRIIEEGTDVAILNFGARLQSCKEAAELLRKQGINPTIVDARFAKPLDESLVRKLAQTHRYIFTIEEGSSGGFASQVLHFAAREGLLDGSCQIIPLTLPDEYLDHNTPEAQYAKCGLDAKGIAKTIEGWVKKDANTSKQYA